MTPEEQRDELEDLKSRVAQLERIVAERLEPDITPGPEEQHEAFVARVRARKGKP